MIAHPESHPLTASITTHCPPKEIEGGRNLHPMNPLEGGGWHYNFIMHACIFLLTAFVFERHIGHRVASNTVSEGKYRSKERAYLDD